MSDGKRPLVYATNDRAAEAEALAPGAERANPKYWAGTLERNVSRVYVLPGSPYAEEIVAAYQAERIPAAIGDEPEPPPPSAAPRLVPSAPPEPVVPPVAQPEELPEWDSKFTPADYAERWPKGPRSELARRYVAAGRPDG